MVWLLASLALAGPFDGCNLVAVGAMDTVMCDGAFLLVELGPAHDNPREMFDGFRAGMMQSMSGGVVPSTPIEIDGAAIAETWNTELEGQKVTLIAAVQPTENETRMAACQVLDGVPGASDRCAPGLKALLSTGKMPDLPREGPPPVRIDVATALGKPFAAEGCEIREVPGGDTMAICAEGIVLLAPLPEGHPATPQARFDRLKAQLGEMGATVVARRDVKSCKVMGADQPCIAGTIQRGGKDSGTIVSAAHPMEGGLLIATCATEGPVSKKACSQFITVP